jgi:hypothetical protein
MAIIPVMRFVAVLCLVSLGLTGCTLEVDHGHLDSSVNAIAIGSDHSALESQQPIVLWENELAERRYRHMLQWLNSLSQHFSREAEYLTYSSLQGSEHRNTEPQTLDQARAWMKGVLDELKTHRPAVLEVMVKPLESGTSWSVYRWRSNGKKHLVTVLRHHGRGSSDKWALRVSRSYFYIDHGEERAGSTVLTVSSLLPMTMQECEIESPSFASRRSCYPP